MSSPLSARWLLGITVVGLVLRLAVVVLRSEQLTDDTDAYLAIARCLLNGDGFCSVAGQPTAYRPPLYPFLVAASLRLGGSLGIGVLQALLGALTVWLTGRLAERLMLGPRVAGVASLLVALDPLLLNYTSQAMTEVTMTFLATGFLWSVSGRQDNVRQAVSSGMWFGLCVLCRPTMWAYALLAALISACLWSVNRRQLLDSNRQPKSLQFAAFIVVVALIQTPWMLRNAMVFGQPILTTTHGGYTLALGNNDAYFRDVVERKGEAHGVWSAAELAAWQVGVERWMEKRGVARSDELARDAAYREQAMKWILQNPGSAMHAAVHRLGSLWAIAPQASQGVPKLVVVMVASFYGLVFMGAAIGLVRTRRQAVEMRHLLILVASVTVLHLAYWANARMRAPLTPVVAIYAALGIRPKTTISKS